MGEDEEPKDEQMGFADYTQQLLTENPSWTWLNYVNLNDYSFWKDSLYQTSFDFDDDQVGKYLFMDLALIS